MVWLKVLPKLEADRDYRQDHDGDGDFLAQSIEMSLCLYCGEWYKWDAVHGQYLGGCHPPGRGTK